MSFGPRPKQPDRKPPKLTSPKPFNLAQPKRKVEAPNESEHPKQKKTKLLKPTIPKSPNLNARKRHRASTLQGFAAREEQELKDMKKNQFRAKSPKFMKMAPVKPVKPKQLTEPQTFKLSECIKAPVVEEVFEEFKAMPFDPEKARTFVAPVTKPRKPTIPMSPDLSFKEGKAKKEEWLKEQFQKKEHDEQEEIQKTFKARPMPKFKAGIAKPLSEPVSTVAKPFNLETDYRGDAYQDDLHRKIQNEEEQAKQDREFVAKDAPSGEYQGIYVTVPPTTIPEPFNLDGVRKHEEYAEDFDRRLQEEREREKENLEFKARPKPSFREVFEPKKLEKLPLEQKPFTMSIDVRAAERQKFDELVKAKMEEQEAQKENLKIEEQEREKDMIVKIRKDAVFKANPIRHYSGLDIKQSEKEPTTPVSPVLATSTRTRRNEMS